MLLTEFALGVATSGATGGLAITYRRLAEVSARRSRRSLWIGRGRTDVVVMVTAYEIPNRRADAHDRRTGRAVNFGADTQAAALATNGVFVSWGMARAMSKLVTFLRGDAQLNVTVVADKVIGSIGERPLVVMGSAANNIYLEAFLREMAGIYPLLGGFRWFVDEEAITVAVPGERMLRSMIDVRESGIDYAVVLIFARGRVGAAQTTIISGSNMWGTEAAVDYLVQQNLARDIARELKTLDGVAVVLRARIVEGRLDSIEIVSREDGQPYYDLRAGTDPG